MIWNATKNGKLKCRCIKHMFISWHTLALTWKPIIMFNKKKIQRISSNYSNILMIYIMLIASFIYVRRNHAPNLNMAVCS